MLAIAVNVSLGYVIVKNTITPLPSLKHNITKTPFSLKMTNVVEIKEDRSYYITVNEFYNPNITETKVLILIYKGQHEISSFLVNPNESYKLNLSYGKYTVTVFISGYYKGHVENVSKYFAINIYYIGKKNH